MKFNKTKMIALVLFYISLNSNIGYTKNGNGNSEICPSAATVSEALPNTYSTGNYRHWIWGSYDETRIRDFVKGERLVRWVKVTVEWNEYLNAALVTCFYETSRSDKSGEPIIARLFSSRVRDIEIDADDISEYSDWSIIERGSEQLEQNWKLECNVDRLKCAFPT